MSSLPVADVAAALPFVSLRFKDFEISWAGAHPTGPGFCFGSEDGRVLLTDENGQVRQGPDLLAESAEAINGIATWQNWWAATTRADFDLWSPPSNDGMSSHFVHPTGCHGVISTPSGYFVAPLGRLGLLLTKPGLGDKQELTVRSPQNNDSYCYRVVCLRADDKREVLVCANRRGGVGVMEFPGIGQAHNLNGVTFDGLDVIDVCPLANSIGGLGVAAMGIDGTLVLIENVLAKPMTPITLRFDCIQGKPYRLLSSKGHLILLTSKKLYVLANLAELRMQGISNNSVSVRIGDFPIEAVDMNLCGERWLLVVMPDEVLKVDFNVIHESVPEFHDEFLPQTLSPAWKQNVVEQLDTSTHTLAA